MTYRVIAHFLCVGLMIAVGPIGCGTRPATKADKKTECGFVFPQSKENVQDFVEYTGRTAAVASVDVKARVTGFLLDTSFFKEGEPVRKGQTLFLIDPTPYEAQLKQAESQVGLYDAQVELTTKTYELKQDLKKKNPSAITDLDLRTTEAQMKVAKAGLESAKASLKIYTLNRDYTKVTSRIDGIVGRKNQTAGNVIIQDQTLLTTVVSLEKMFVYFDMDAPTYAQFHSSKQDKAAPAPLFLDLPSNSSSADTPSSQVTGSIDFFNNQFNPATDTLLVRGVFDNPAKKDGGSRLRPGMFVRVRAMIGQPYRALVVPDRAILSKMGKKYVYVVGDDNRVKEIPVTIGQLQEQGLRVIKDSPLTEKDRVIVTRLLDVQPNQEVAPVPIPPSTGK